MIKQASFDLAPVVAPTFDNFISDMLSLGIVDHLQKPVWDFPVFLIYGEEGAGKSHLGQSWLSSCSPAAQIALSDTFDPASYKNHYIFLDDANLADEQLLFTIINMVLNSEAKSLLMTSRDHADDWNVELPDLRSRLKNIPSAQLTLPNEDTLEAIYRGFFEARGRIVNADLVQYLLKHAERSIPVMRQLVSELDELARSEKKDLTWRFASKYLKTKT